MRFSKYSGCGNDFVIVDKAELSAAFSSEEVRFLCHRHQGIGADGVILYGPSLIADFSMHIYNADGSEASMCGNGIRCLAHALFPKIKSPHFTIQSKAGMHQINIEEDEITVSMTPPQVQNEELTLSVEEKKWVGMHINTGVPHFVIKSENLSEVDVEKVGKQLRFHPHFGQEGSNVTFYAITQDGIAIRTYERGVEAETLACGTGACAAAYAADFSSVYVKLPSQESLFISVEKKTGSIFMKGKVKHIFDGVLTR